MLNTIKKLFTGLGITLIAGAFITEVFLIVFLTGLWQPSIIDCDPNKSSPEIRMAEFYGGTFTLLSAKPTPPNDFMVWTMQDSSGLECHASRSKEYSVNRDIERMYDDYYVLQHLQTPAMQRLIAQKDFQISYQSELGQKYVVGNDYPTCRWVIGIENYEDIPAALRLALDTVTAEDSVLPPAEFHRTDYWYSLQPMIQLGFQDLGTYAFSDTENIRTYDYDAELEKAQARFRSE